MSKNILSYQHNSSSFTLIELLITIAIIAVLMSIAAIAINPAEMMKRSRDTKRFTDLSNLEMVLTMARSEGLLTPAICDGAKIYISLPSGTPLPNNLPSGVSWVQVSEDNLRKSDGTGWIPINMSNINGLSMPTLPVDPKNTLNDNLYYTFYCNSQQQYILTSYMESKTFGPKGNETSKTNKDGGPDPYLYEVGSNLFISPLKPVGSWSFDEGTGTIANDSSGNNNKGTLYNGPTWIDGQVNKALSFDGIDDYVNTINNIGITGNQSRTVSVWFYPKSFNKNIVGFGINENGKLFDMLTLSDEKLRGHFYGGGYDTIAENSPIITLNKWNFGVITYNGTTVSVYLNGKFGNSKDILLDTGNSTLTIGGGKYSIYNYFKGLIDEVRIYNRALSAEEIKRHYEMSK